MGDDGCSDGRSFASVGNARAKSRPIRARRELEVEGGMKPIHACWLLLCLSAPAGAAIVADHAAVAEWEAIPAANFADIRAGYHIFYGHTSHGSQIVTDLAMLADEDAALYALPSIQETGGDLGHLGDTSWVAPTRSYLDQHPEFNVVV